MIAAGYSARDGRTGIDRPADAIALVLVVLAVGSYVGVFVILSPTMG